MSYLNYIMTCKLAYLKRMTNSAIYYEIDRRIHHHKCPCNDINLIILQGRKKLSFIFHAIYDKICVSDFFSTNRYPW